MQLGLARAASVLGAGSERKKKLAGCLNRPGSQHIEDARKARACARLRGAMQPRSLGRARRMGLWLRRDEIWCRSGSIAESKPMFVLRSKGTNRGQAIRARPRVNKPCMRRNRNYLFANSIMRFRRLSPHTSTVPFWRGPAHVFKNRTRVRDYKSRHE